MRFSVLHVPYTFLPDASGGTEIYVLGLVRELAKLGIPCVVAAPGVDETHYKYDDIEVFRFPVSEKTENSEGVPNLDAAKSFRKIIGQVEPDIVHLHARSAAVSNLLFETAKDRGAKTVLTYHTPTVSCKRGTMLERGVSVCDGKLDPYRCSACALTRHGLSGALAAGFASLPPSIGRALSRAGIKTGPALAFRMRQILEDDQARIRDFWSKADRVVAVCDWVADVLRINGVDDSKLVLNRQGVSSQFMGVRVPTPNERKDSILKLAYFGRLHRLKGPQTLIDAILSVPHLEVTLDIFGVLQEYDRKFARNLKDRAKSDPRIRFRDPIDSDEVCSVMARFDMIAIPSLWMETGPLVALEAFAAGVPVLGSRLGGIKELVTEAVDGILVEAGNVNAWAQAITEITADKSQVRRLAKRVKSPRTMSDAAKQMASVYQDLVNVAS